MPSGARSRLPASARLRGARRQEHGTGGWRDLPETDDNAGGADDTVVPVEVLRVGSKMLPGGETIYQQPNPADE